ncbi:MAG: XRE family transcriptional regulator [Fibrobacterota bacterium]
MSAYNFEVLRFLRKSRNLTIEALAKKSGVSFAVISKLERNQTNPGLETVRNLAGALHISASELIAMAEVKPNEIREQTTYDSDGFHFEKVEYNNAKIVTVTGTTGKNLSHPEAHEDDTEIVFVRKGRVKLTLPTGVVELRTGESVQFDALFSHTYETLKDCELIIVHVRKEKRF